MGVVDGSVGDMADRHAGDNDTVRVDARLTIVAGFRVVDTHQNCGNRILGPLISVVLELESTDASEGRNVYKMLSVVAAVAAGGSLEASGEVMSVSDMEASST